MSVSKPKTTLDSEALDEAAKYLSAYILAVKEDIGQMKAAKQDFLDNMRRDGKEEYSLKLSKKIIKALEVLESNMKTAEKLETRIIKKKNEIEESGKILG